MTETSLATNVCDMYTEKTTLTIDSVRNAMAGRAILSDPRRTGAKLLRARYAHSAVIRKVIFTSGIDDKAGPHSEVSPTRPARKSACHMLDAEAPPAAIVARDALAVRTLRVRAGSTVSPGTLSAIAGGLVSMCGSAREARPISIAARRELKSASPQPRS